jgi:hypothetical protein
MKPDLSIDLCGIKMANPIVTVSGTCGNGRELAQFYDLGVLGAFTAKSTTLGFGGFLLQFFRVLKNDWEIQLPELPSAPPEY